MMNNKTVFAKIIAHELPAYIVAEDGEHIAFLDIFPVVQGHTLVVPKREVDYLFDMEDDELKKLICFAKKVAQGIQRAVPCQRIGVKVHGLEVAHAHIHLIPLQKEEDFTRQTSVELTELTMATIANDIRQAIFGKS